MSKKQTFRRTYAHEALIRYARLLGFGRIHTKVDPKTGLNAIIAVHDTTLGPALGGVRCYHYTAAGSAYKDALRLAYMMTLKSAFSDIPHGGAKSVLIKPTHIKDRKAYFHSFGDFVHELNGHYIAAMDVGTTTEDMDAIAERTPYVIGAAKMHQAERDPAPCTAMGVLCGIKAAVKFKLNHNSMDGLHIVIQGAGHVGYHLAKELHQLGATITMSDINPAALQRCVDEFNVNTVDTGSVYELKCDVFSPCAMGGVINGETYHSLNAPIVAGSANNQLAHSQIGLLLHKRGILYAPDFVINAGGLISAAIDYGYRDPDMADAKIQKIYNHMLALFERAAKENLPTTTVARLIATEKIKYHKDQREAIYAN